MSIYHSRNQCGMPDLNGIGLDTVRNSAYLQHVLGPVYGMALVLTDTQRKFQSKT